MAIIATDDFNRTDAPDLGANWATQTGEATLEVISNEANTGTMGRKGNRYTNVAWPDDQYSQITGVTAAVGAEHSARCRCSTTAQTYYAGGHQFVDFGNDDHRIWKVVGGTPTSLASETPDHAAGDIYKLECQGTALRLFINGIEKLSATDSAIASGQAGIGAHRDSASNLRLDGFEGGDLGAFSFAYTAQGGITSAGAAALAFSLLLTGAGGVATDGAASLAISFSYTGAGALSSAGEAPLFFSYPVAPSGRLQSAGAAPHTFAHSFLPAGGLVSAGLADLRYSFLQGATGGLVAGGAAPHQLPGGIPLILEYTGVGGLVAGGAGLHVLEYLPPTVLPPAAVSRYPAGQREIKRSASPRVLKVPKRPTEF